MKRIVLLLFLATVPLFAEFDPDWLNTVTFQNDTGSDIYYLFFSPSDSDIWAPDILGASTIFSNGDTLENYVLYSGASAYFDCQAIDEEGNVYEIYRQRITDKAEAVVRLSKENRTDRVDLDEFEENILQFSVDNLTGSELYYLFISPEDSEEYGIDFMDSESTLTDGDSLEVAVINLGEEFTYDLQAVDEFNQTYSFAVDLNPDLESQYVEVVPGDLDEE